MLITALNIIEAVATEDRERRVSLLRLQQHLAKGNRPLRIPTKLLRKFTLARVRRLPSITLTIDETGAGVWWALYEPEKLNEEARQEAYTWKTGLEKAFTEVHRQNEETQRIERSEVSQWGEVSAVFLRFGSFFRLLKRLLNQKHIWSIAY